MEQQIATRRRFLQAAMMAAVAVTGFTIAEATRPAAAMPVLPSADPDPDNGYNVEPAHTLRRWRYSRRRYGPRYRYRRRGYTYYYGGWYYPRPWWRPGPWWFFGPGIYIDL